MYTLGLLAALIYTTASHALGPRPGTIKNIVSFGDSYTAPGITGDNGTAWPGYVADYARLTLYDFAKAGATCSNNLTFRPFPSIMESQVPLFLEEKNNGTLNELARNEDETVYTLWIGTNDVGVSALLTGGQANGITIVDTVTCAVDWVSLMYKNGARNFVFQNMIPLEDNILYSANSYPNMYWSFPRNTTEWSLFITELTTAGNEIAKLMLQNLAPTLPGAHIALFDSHGLFSDIFAHPAEYLNGTAPLNVTGAIHSCVYELNSNTAIECTVVEGTDRDSYLWYDELHPSEQADRIVARNIADGILGIPSRWFTWIS